MPRIQMPDDFYDQTPEGNVLATEAVMNTIRTADLLFDRIGRLLRPLNVSAAGGLVLGILRDQGPMSPSALSDRLIVTRATVTGVLDSLERRGFVSRLANPVDRRGQIAEITPAGRVVLQQLRTLVHGHERTWAGVLSDEELRTYIDLHHRLQDSVNASMGGVADEPAR
ncbi:MAG: MarR family transcriptional regulator [Chloroflexi bacterium]|nr:MarR family transcriptional regulator [Chloroflexota bacterium]